MRRKERLIAHTNLQYQLLKLYVLLKSKNREMAYAEMIHNIGRRKTEKLDTILKDIEQGKVNFKDFDDPEGYGFKKYNITETSLDFSDTVGNYIIFGKILTIVTILLTCISIMAKRCVQ